MTRHGKNSTASSVYTYHERRKDAKQSGYGSLTERLTKDSIKDFDCCCITLQPCRNPMVSPDGHLFDKEAILEYILHQKKRKQEMLKEWEKQEKEAAVEEEEAAQSSRRETVKKFIEHSARPTASKAADVGDSNSSDQPKWWADAKSSFGADESRKRKVVQSFWVPELQPEAKKSRMAEKPSQKVLCPMSGKPLKMSDLIPVKFTPVPTDDKQPIASRKARYMCPVTHDILTNSVPSAVLRTSGSVVTWDCVEKIIKKEWIDPISETKITEKDIIPLSRGGTGFASTNESLKSKKLRAVMEIA